MEKKSKKTIVIGITSLFLIMLILLGLTYAYYRTRIIGNDADTSISVQSKKMEVTYQDGTATLSTEGKIEPGFTASKEFYVSNTGSESVKYSVLLENVVNEYSRQKDWTYTLTQNDSVISEGTLPNEDGYLVKTTELPADTTDVYVLTVTYNNSSEDQTVDMGKKLRFKVNIAEGKYTWNDAPEGSLLYAIKKDNTNNGQLVSSPTTIPGRAVSTESILTTTEDDDGTSYYFRGGVTNNYVTYSGMCWRIVRVQGDGNIKLVLADENNVCSENTEDGYSTENEQSAFIDGVSDLNLGLGSYSLQKISETNVPSIIDTWTKRTDKPLDLGSVVSAKWCNDTIEYQMTGWGYDENGVQTDDYFSAVEWYVDYLYGAYGRLGDKTTATPTLKCTDYSGNSTYVSKIALLTADEIAFAGSISGSNGNSYLLTNAKTESYYSSITMSPMHLNQNDGMTYYGISADYGLSMMISGDPGAVRPTIVLDSNVFASTKSDVATYGQPGTQGNPYVIG